VLEEFEGYHLAQIGRKISETIDLNSSAEEGRTVIMPGIDEELDQMKQTLDSLDDFLNRVARKLSEKMPSDIRKSVRSYQCLTFPP
jgi:DNA mismatch repair protein MSH5